MKTEDPLTETVNTINGLPEKTKQILYAGLGPNAARRLVRRYGKLAPSVVAKNCVEHIPRDPMLHVDVQTGEVTFDHVREFVESPWGICTTPRPGSLVAVFKHHDDWYGRRLEPNYKRD